MDLRVSLLIASSGCRIPIIYLAKIAIFDKGVEVVYDLDRNVLA